MAGVPLPAFLLTQRVRSSTFSTSKYHSYPMDIITLLFTFVKCFTLFTQFCKIRFSYPIERHNRVFVIGMFRIKSQSYNDIQVTVGQMFYHQDSSGVFIVDKDLIRTEDRIFSVLFKQFVILRMVCFDMFESFISNDHFIGIKFTEFFRKWLCVKFS